MKKLILIVIVTLAAANLVNGQKGEMVPKPPKKVSAVVKRENIFLTTWGVKSVDLPDNLAERRSEIHPNQHDDVTWNDCSVSWERNPKKTGPKIFEVKVSITTWDVPFAKIAPDIKPELATPENFLQIDVMADLRNKEEKNSPTLEAGYHEIDGVTGGLTIIRDPGDKTRVIAIWETFRFYKTKPQRVMVQVTADPSQRAAATKIIDSLRLEKPVP